MTSADFDNEGKLKAKRPEAAASPRADQAHPLGRAGALGNAAIQRLLRSSVAGAELDDAIAGDIESKRGGGQSLDAEAQRNLGPALGDDFSDVRVHTDAESNALNHDLQADAFTTGKDIFFREGKYNPGSSDGQKLLAHELTHVTQQRNAPSGGGGMTVSDPGDASERQASDVAEKVGSQSAAAVSREGLEEEELAMSRSLDREEAPEEEELAMSPTLDREEVPEEELAMSPALDREEVPEEEELAMSPTLDREEVPEEEELAMSPTLDREEAPEEEELQMSPVVHRAMLDDLNTGVGEAVESATSTNGGESESPSSEVPQDSTLMGDVADQFKAQDEPPPGVQSPAQQNLGGPTPGGGPAPDAISSADPATPPPPAAAPKTMGQQMLEGTAGRYLTQAQASIAGERPKRAEIKAAVDLLDQAKDVTKVVGSTEQVEKDPYLDLLASSTHNIILGNKKDLSAHLGELRPIERIREDIKVGEGYLENLGKKLP